MSKQKQGTPRGLLTAEALAEIENSSTSHLPDLGDVIAQYMDEKERLLAHVAAMQAELDRWRNEAMRISVEFPQMAVEGFRQRAVAAVRALSDNQLNRTMICAMLQQLPATTEGGE